MTATPHSAIIRIGGRLCRVDGVLGEVFTATSFDGAQAEQVRCCFPLEKILPGRIIPPKTTQIHCTATIISDTAASGCFALAGLCSKVLHAGQTTVYFSYSLLAHC